MIPLWTNLRVKRFPYLTALLVIVNVLVYFGWQTWDNGRIVDVDKVVLYGAIPYEITMPGNDCVPDLQRDTFKCGDTAELEKAFDVEFPSTAKTMVTSMFMHGGIGHLIGNMIFLIVFGIAVEAGFGRRGYLLFYLLGGLAAILAHTVFDPHSPIPTLGASGAISAVMGGYVLMYPRSMILTWILPPIPIFLRIRAVWVIGLLMAYQVLQAYVVIGSSYGGGGGVAYFAHFGGFAAGAILVLTVMDRERLEQLRREARIASGDERMVRDRIEVPDGVPATARSEAAAAHGGYRHAVSGQTIQDQAVQPRPPAAYAQPPAAVAAVPPDPFAPPPAPVVPPDPFAPPRPPAT